MNYKIAMVDDGYGDSGPSGLVPVGMTIIKALVDALGWRCEAFMASRYRRLRLSIGVSRSIGDLRRSRDNAL